MSKELAQLRDGIDDVYSELLASCSTGTLSMREIRREIRSRLPTEIDASGPALQDLSLDQLIHQVGRRRRANLPDERQGDFLAGYKRIPQSLTDEVGNKKLLEKFSIPELEGYLDEHTRKKIEKDHSELRRLISDLRIFVQSSNDSIELLLRRRDESN